MFKSSADKFFFALFLIFTSACGFWRGGEGATPTPVPSVTQEIKSEIPFSTVEPEIYQTEIVNQTYAGSEKTERIFFTARNGTNRLTVFNVGDGDETSLLEAAGGQTFSIHRARKIYAENQSNPQPAEGTLNDFLKTEWLNQKTPAAFESLGKENNLAKFRVSLGDAQNQPSEILIFVDENLRLPVRQEFYVAGDGSGQKTPVFSVELRNFKTTLDEKLFELPKDYRKVSIKEFQEIVWQERIKNE